MAKKLDDDKKQAIKVAIAEHLAIEGPRNWDPLVERLGISKVTLHKYVKEIQGIAGSDEAPGLLRLAQKRINQTIKPIEDAKEAIADHLPAMPSPNVVAAKGESAIVNVNFMMRLEQLYQDAEMIRAYSTVKDAEGKEKIKNPVFFASSIKQRRELLETALHAMQEVYDLNRMQQFYDLILDEIGKVDPEMQRTILERLRALNNRYGITMEARIA